MGPHPVLIVIHGGYWRARYSLEHIGHLCAALASHGVATWNIEYRRLGNPGGGWPGTWRDVADAANYLTQIAPQYNLDLNRVGVMGHSAGGELALWLAGLGRVPPASPIHIPPAIQLRMAVSLAGVTDLRRAWELGLSGNVVNELLGSPDEHAERYAAASPVELVPLRVRQFLLHGMEDRNVPVELSRHYHKAAAGAGDDVTLVELPGTGDFELIDPESGAWPRVWRVVQDGLVRA
jgi:acetyl esterase/lipase